MQIHKAATDGDKDAILRELESGVPVDATNDQDCTPLMMAVSSTKSNLEVVQLLLERGADPNATGGKHHASVLVKAVISENLAYVRCLLDADAEVNMAVKAYGDALTVAVRAGRSDTISLMSMVELLLERGASIHREIDGESALSTAFEKGHFDVVKRLLEAGADEQLIEWTPLMRATAIGTVDDVREQLEQGASLSDRDGWLKRTPWLLSLAGGDIEKARLLLAAGANRHDVGHCGKTALIYPLETNHPEMLKWLLSIGCDIDATDEFGNTALMEASSGGFVPFVRLLLEAGANIQLTDQSGNKAITHVSSLEVVRLLVAQGEDLNDVSSHARSLLLGIEEEGVIVCSREEFDTGRLPRFGTANPQKMDIPFWHAMVRSGVAAYTPRAVFIPEDEMFTEVEQANPVWCYSRYGKSLTELPDGRFIEIGGEHEDWYDTDFCIYNDVFVHHPGKTFDIYGYPEALFPPTDFHSATLADGFIYIIGCLGYPEQRVVGYTPVYRLNTQTFAIEKVETSGDNPGWIYRHKAVLNGDEIHISGGESWNGPPSPEESAERATRMQKMVEFPVQEDYASVGEWIEATGQHLDENKIEQYESPERFALNLKSLTWRRITD